VKLVKLLKAHAGITAASAVLVLGGAGAATAAVVTTSADNPAPSGQVETVETTPVSTPSVADVPVVENATPAAEVAKEPAVAPQPATVPAVTEPAQTAAPEAPAKVGDQSGDTYDPYAPYTDSSGMTYVPAPEEVVPPMRCEPGYVPPAS